MGKEEVGMEKVLRGSDGLYRLPAELRSPAQVLSDVKGDRLGLRDFPQN